MTFVGDEFLLDNTIPDISVGNVLSAFDILRAGDGNDLLNAFQALGGDAALESFADPIGMGEGQPSVALNRNDCLVGSNIGSSGQDGVRID